MAVLVRPTCSLRFLGRDLKISQISNSMKIRPVGGELLHVDRQKNFKQTDRQKNEKREADIVKLIVAYLDFPNS